MPKWTVKVPGLQQVYIFEGDHPPTEQDIAQAVQMDPTRKPANPADFTPPQSDAVANLAKLLPLGGAAIGGIAGGPGGAALGGAAGKGYESLLANAREIGPAISDITDNAISQWAPMLEAGLIGAGRGAGGAATEGALQGALEAGGGLVMRGVGKGASAVMRGIVKPSLASNSVQDARQIVQTIIDEALPIGGGEAKANRLIADLNKQVNAELDQTTGTVDLHAVANRVRSFAKAKYFKPGIDDADFKAAMGVADTLDQHASQAVQTTAPVTQKVTSPIVGPGGETLTRDVTTEVPATTFQTDVPASVANVVKQDVRPPSRAFGAQGVSAETATRKAAGAELRQSIEDLVQSQGGGNVHALNERMGRLIDARDALQQAEGRIGNRDQLGGAANIISGAVGLTEGYRRDPISGLTWALAVRAGLEPAVASRAVILAARFAKLPGMVPADAARLGIAFAQQQQ
jgi:hypothetical protein